MAESESVLCVKAEVKVYRIPPRASSRGHRAADWKLDEADWSGRLRVMTRGEAAFVRLEDSHTGELFAEAPVDSYPGIAVENVTDSSRYFVLRIQDGSGRRAFIGIGFADREDAFDFNVALQEHFKRAKQEADASKREEDSDPGPKLDLGFKEGETIELQIGNVKGRDRSRPRTAAGGAVPLLPPPGGRTAGASPTRSVGNAQTRKIGGADTKATRPQADSNPIPLDKFQSVTHAERHRLNLLPTTTMD